MIDDTELLRRYVEGRSSGSEHASSDEAFAALVRRHIDFVYGAALRQADGDHALAQDVTQTVFIELARKAASLVRHPALVGWLHTATRFGVARVRRAESRRIVRERAAHTPEGTLADPAPDIDWSGLQPVFDEVLGQLKPRERDAILLRFFEHRPHAEIGARLALSESAARSCIDRALDKMRVALMRRGVTSTVGCLGVALANHVGTAAPAGLASVVTGAALAGSSAPAAASVLALFAMTKTQTAVLSALIVAGAATFTWERQQTQAVAVEVAALRAEHATLVALQQENQRLAAIAPRASDAAAAPSTTSAPRTAAVLAASSIDEETAGLLAAGMKPMSQWKNSGRATPAAAFETLLLAGLTDDFDLLAPMITFTPAGKAELDAWFAALPPQLQARFGTPERAIAPAFAEDYPWFQRLRPPLWPASRQIAYKLVGVSEPDRGGTVTVRVLFSAFSDPDRPSEVRLLRSPDGINGWRAGRMVESMVKRFTDRIDPTTGELRAAQEKPVSTP